MVYIHPVQPITVNIKTRPNVITKPIKSKSFSHKLISNRKAKSHPINVRKKESS